MIQLINHDSVDYKKKKDFVNKRSCIPYKERGSRVYCFVDQTVGPVVDQSVGLAVMLTHCLGDNWTQL